MRETSELPTTSFPHPPTSFPHPPTSFPRRRESIPLCITFDKTELLYYPRPMDTPRNRSPRRHLAIPNLQSPIPQTRRLQNPTECNTIQHDATGCYESSCPRARGATPGASRKNFFGGLVPARARRHRLPNTSPDTAGARARAREAPPGSNPTPCHSVTSCPRARGATSDSQYDGYGGGLVPARARRHRRLAVRSGCAIARARAREAPPLVGYNRLPATSCPRARGAFCNTKAHAALVCLVPARARRLRGWLGSLSRTSRARPRARRPPSRRAGTREASPPVTPAPSHVIPALTHIISAPSHVIPAKAGIHPPASIGLDASPGAAAS